MSAHQRQLARTDQRFIITHNLSTRQGITLEVRSPLSGVWANARLIASGVKQCHLIRHVGSASLRFRVLRHHAFRYHVMALCMSHNSSWHSQTWHNLLTLMVERPKNFLKSPTFKILKSISLPLPPNNLQNSFISTSLAGSKIS